MTFSPIPEIVFVRGYQETEHMGIFHIDTANRWQPGDLTNSAGWKPKYLTNMKILKGSLTGVNYDSSTAVLNYDGSGSGSETAEVVLEGPGGIKSSFFNIRILKPNYAWGVNADIKFPGIGYNSNTTTWIEVRKKLVSNASYDNPNVFLITAGTYQEGFGAGELLNSYILGEPSGRPKLIGDEITQLNFEVAYFKNFELEGTTLGGGKYKTDRKVNRYITKVYQHTSVGEVNGIGTPAYEGDSKYGFVAPPAEWHIWVWNFLGRDMGGSGNTTHQFYIEGRPNAHLHLNNIKILGTRGNSAVKSTAYYVDVRNSYISAVQNENNLLEGNRATILLDLVSAGERVIYNNELIGAHKVGEGGTQNGLIFFRQRRDWWGCDTPAYPDISWSPPISTVGSPGKDIYGNYLPGPGYLAPLGFTAGPETFVNPKFWDAVKSYALDDPKNPYSFKKFISYNKFRWLNEEVRRPAFRDDGTEPRTAVSMFSSNEYQGTIPEGWVDRSVSFFANNSYEGWTIEDVNSTKPRWFSLDNQPPESLMTKHGPGPWLQADDPRNFRKVVRVGGEKGPDLDQAEIKLPVWFKK